MKKYLESYVYKDILKNPPKEEGHEDYFPTVDLDESLDAINTQNTDFYTQYQQLKAVINSAYDMHLSFSLTSNSNHDYYVDRLFALSPFTVALGSSSSYYVLAKY